VDHNKGNAKPVVVVISARQEWRITLDYYSPRETSSSPYGDWFLDPRLSERTGRKVIFFHGGWGKISAAGSAQYAIDHWEPGLLFNLGTCGGFAGQIEKGDIILVDKTIVYDIIEQMLPREVAIQAYTTNLDLSWLKKDLPQAVRRTMLVSGDRDLVASEIPALMSEFQAVAGDWESGAIAYVANANRVRCLILRGVSDLVSPQDGGEAYGNLEVFQEGTNLVMRSLFKHAEEWISCALD
jgi:adenosylhomocysteine nucleosidase